MIYFSSDFHYGHKNIVAGVSEWEDKSRCRPFKTLEEHDKTLVENINKVVKRDDTLYFLGDWSFGGIENIWNFRKQIKCKDIHFILGNHDHHIFRGTNIPGLSIEEVNNTLGINIIKDTDNLALSDDVSTSMLFSSVNYKRIDKINGRLFVINHFAERVWDRSHHGSIMLYGHSHGTLDEFTPNTANPTWIGDQYYIKNYKTMDVGIDTHPEFRPYSITEIINIMNKREVTLEIDKY